MFELYPPVAPPFAVTKQDTRTIEFLWRLYNRLPKRQPRLYATYDIMRRRHARHNAALLPRASFTSTVDYYEAAMLLLVARTRFRHAVNPRSYMRSVQQACATVLPEKLF